MLNSKKTKTLLAVATSVSAVSGRVNAIEPEDVLVFSKEPVSLRPQLSISETYNDNIFYEPTDEVEDFVTTISPGLKFQLGKGDRNFLGVEYTYDHHFYADQSDLNAGEHTVDLRNRLQGERLVLTGADRIGFLSSPVGTVEEFSIRSPGLPSTNPGVPTTPGGGTTTPSPGGDGGPAPSSGNEVISTVGRRNVDRTVHYHTYNLGYEISEKTSVYLQGLLTDTDYERNVRLYDINTWRGTLGFGYAAFPKTSFFGEVYYGQTTSRPSFPGPNNPYSEFIGGFLGARGNFTEKLTGVVRVGYESRSFNDDSEAPSSPVADIALTQRFTEKTSLTLSYARIHDVSIQFAQESYTANLVRLELNQVLGSSGKWFTGVGGTYGNYDYEGAAGADERGYDRYSAYFNLAYRIQEWLTANLGYSFETISSDSTGVSEYDVNRVMISLAVGY